MCRLFKKYTFSESEPNDKQITESIEVDTNDTLAVWKEKATRLAFIYDVVIEKYSRRINFVTFIALLLTSLASLTNLGNIGLNHIDYPIVDLVLKILSAIFVTFATFLMGIVYKFEWPTTVNKCTKYLNSVEYFLALIITKLPKDSTNFITKHQHEFHTLLISAPNIPHSDYQSASQKYRQSKYRFRKDLINV